MIARSCLQLIIKPGSTAVLVKLASGDRTLVVGQLFCLCCDKIHVGATRFWSNRNIKKIMNKLQWMGVGRMDEMHARNMSSPRSKW